MKKNIIFILLSFVFIKNGITQPSELISYKKISSSSGAFNGISTDIRFFGSSVCSIGDINKDGVNDIAVGAGNSSTLSGVIFIILLNSNNTVKSYSRIEPGTGNWSGSFPYSLSDIGAVITNLGDLNNDGVNDIATGNRFGGGNGAGQVFILFLNNDGTVKNYSIIGSNNLTLGNNFNLGSSITTLGYVEGKKFLNLAIGVQADNESGLGSGSVFIVSIDSLGEIKKSSKINKNTGNFFGNPNGSFGYYMGLIGDLNKDGVNDILVGSILNQKPEMWLLFIDTNQKVLKYTKIAKDSGSYTDSIYNYERFGYSISSLADIDGDGVIDICISSPFDSVNSTRTGRIRVLYLNQNGTVKSIKRIDNNATNFSGVLKDGDNFGSGLSGGFDFDGDFKNDLIVGAASTDDGGENKGAIYLLSLDGAVHPTPPKALWRVNATSGNQNTVFNFTQYSTGFPSAYKWSIFPNTFTYQNGTSDTSANPIIKFNATANYSVQLKVTNPFSSDSLLRSSYISVQTVGINNLTKNSAAISIFPNPTHGLVQIQSPVNMQSILVFDITGKQLLQQEPNTQTDEINISNLPQGLYQIHVQTEMGMVVKKLVKE